MDLIESSSQQVTRSQGYWFLLIEAGLVRVQERPIIGELNREGECEEI